MILRFVIRFAQAASIASLFAFPGQACINESRPSAAPDLSEAPLIRVTPADAWSTKQEELNGILARLRNTPAFKTDPDLQNDYAVALIRTRNAAEAITVLESIEANWPGRYQTASNLGAAYEHSGNNELALKWVSEGLSRNPRSHKGTEWLHVRILQAKIAREKDPNWLASYSIYDGGAPLTGNKAAPDRVRAFADADGKPRTAKDVIEATAFQLNERLRFAKAPDAIVGELLLELASVAALERGVDVAMPVLDLAAEFKPVRAELLEARRAHFGKMMKDLPRVSPPQPAPEPSRSWLAEIAAVLVLAAIVFGLVRRSRSNRKQEAAQT